MVKKPVDPVEALQARITELEKQNEEFRKETYKLRSEAGDLAYRVRAAEEKAKRMEERCWRLVDRMLDDSRPQSCAPWDILAGPHRYLTPTP